VFKNAAKKSALFLALIIALTAPASRIYAQSVVSGGDPEPTGEPRPIPGAVPSSVILIPYLISLA
jgi:hypothetical protein